MNYEKALGLRKIAGYSKYRIGVFGGIYTDTGTRVPLRKGTYPMVSIIDDYDDRQLEPVYVLVAEAWVTNPDPENNLCVNHIDGIKHHHWAENLEWVTYGRNLQHAYETGLRTDNTPTCIKYVGDDKVHTFTTSAQVARKLDIQPSVLYYQLNGSMGVYCVNGLIYQVQYESENMKWLTDEEAIDKYIRGNFKRIRIIDGDKVTVVSGTVEASKVTGANVAVIGRLCKSGRPHRDTNIIYQYADIPNQYQPTYIKPKWKQRNLKKVKVTDLDGNSVIYDSYKECCKAMSVSGKTLRRNIKEKRCYQKHFYNSY